MKRLTALALGVVFAVLPHAALGRPMGSLAMQPSATGAISEVPGLRRVVPDAMQDTAATRPDIVGSRWQRDLAAMQMFRPGYSFWQHIFIIPDGSIAFGSATDGRLLGSVPERGDWTRAVEANPLFAAAVAGETLPANAEARRVDMLLLLERTTGPVLHNRTRGNFLLPNARRYGGFLGAWGSIYERFGVPAEVGLAQAIL
jgi:hypothetical protein